MSHTHEGSKRFHNPDSWIRSRYPTVFADDPDQQVFHRHDRKITGVVSPYRIARCLGPEGSPEAPLRYCSEAGTFYHYCPTEGIYLERDKHQVRQRLNDLYEACASHAAPRKRAQVRRGGSSSSKEVVGAIMGGETFPVPGKNRDLRFLHVSNGIVDLETLALLPFTPGLPSTWKLPVPWEADAEEPIRFQRLLRRIFPHPDDRELALEVLASSFLGNPGQKMLLLAGEAGKGKSTLISLLTGLLGPGASGNLNLKYADGRFTSLGWAGRLLLYQSEVTQELVNKGIDALKAISGHDPMAGERKNGPTQIPFTPIALPVLVTNRRIRFFATEDYAAVERRLVPFDVPESKDEFTQVPHYERILLQEEGPEILRLLLTAAHRVKHHGIRPMTEAQELRVHRYLCLEEPLEYWAKKYLRRGDSSLNLLRDEAIAHASSWLGAHGFRTPQSPGGWSKRLKPVIGELGGVWSNSLKDAPKGWRHVELV